MLRRFECPNCCEHGWVISEGVTNHPRCLRCGHRVEFKPAAFEAAARESSTFDDAVVSWLSDAPLAPLPASAAVASCRSCGFEGLMQYDSAKGDTICPACLAVYWRRPNRRHPVIDCPNCRRPIEVHESDRGKTIVCAGCNYFLGCVLRAEKRRFGALPFLNALLGGAKS
jgi:hypothetical protein